MADVKISALPLASTPLAGTEVLPIVQSATTDQVSVANLTAGRSVSAASLTLTTTPLAVGSGGTGLSTLTAGYIPYGNGTSAFSSSSGFVFDGSSLGLGISTPGSKLHVNGGNIQIQNATGAAYLYANNTSGQFYLGINNSTGSSFGGDAYARIIYGAGAYPVAIYTNDTERMRITSGGLVGIGTTAPSCVLDIQGAGGNVALQIKRDANSVFQIYQGSGITYLDAAASGGIF
ncbi:MAG: hypothetical protein EB015_19115, partial [Methylocystaceae bacterium]|nr:hypothetical protein [Methylocystaceae bacterium]